MSEPGDLFAVVAADFAVEWVHNAVKTLDAVLRDPGTMGSKIESPAGADAQTQFLNFVGRAV